MASIGDSQRGRRRDRARRRRRERLKGELRELVFRSACAAGLLLALPWAISYRAAPKPCLHRHDCVAHALTSAMWPVIARAGVGLAAGAVVGIIVCATVPGLRQRSARVR